jgi:hypothetical protein
MWAQVFKLQMKYKKDQTPTLTMPSLESCPSDPRNTIKKA